MVVAKLVGAQYCHRRVNDQLGEYIAERLIKLMARSGISIAGARVLVLGLASKENCPDIRNTRVIDLIHRLQTYNARVDVFDPWIEHAEVKHEYEIEPSGELWPHSCDAVILAVSHCEFSALGAEGFRRYGSDRCVIFDMKHVLPAGVVNGRL